MNYQRILRVTSGFLLLTGYQLRSLDPKSLRYRLSLWSVLNFLLIALTYTVSFGHHFEKSALLKIALDLSPFLKNLIILQIWLGLKVFIFCIIEWKSVTSVLNGLVSVLTFKTNTDDDTSASPLKTRWCNEVAAYFIFFITLIVALAFGLYIAIEMKFEFPPSDNIMIALALLIPHFIVSGSLRLHNIILWLLRNELENYKQLVIQKNEKDPAEIVIEIINPVLKTTQGDVELVKNSSCESSPIDIYDIVLKGIQSIADFLKSTNGVLQRQMLILNGLNYNCLLYGIFNRLYFEKYWHLVFLGRLRRIFYAANSVIFVCIFLDYLLLISMHICFDKMMQSIMLLSIGIIIVYQYFNDQIDAVTQLVEHSNDDDE
ncbi:gustatory receptor-like 40a [Haematobia irritans]|uniref:gustatory receptor-like 40a n=1 Tax=Haematobia irritans TaxID=7368 RepID=UPI003F4F7C62